MRRRTPDTHAAPLPTTVSAGADDTAPEHMPRRFFVDLATYEGKVRSAESTEYARLGVPRPYPKLAEEEEGDRSLNILAIRSAKNLASGLVVASPMIKSSFQAVASFAGYVTPPAGLLPFLSMALLGGAFAADHDAILHAVVNNLLIFKDGKDLFVIQPGGPLNMEPVHPLTTELKGADPAFRIHYVDLTLQAAEHESGYRCGKLSAICADRIEHLVSSEIIIDGEQRSFAELSTADKTDLIRAYLGVYIESEIRMDALFESLPERIRMAAVDRKNIADLYTTEKPLFIASNLDDGKPWMVNNLTVSHRMSYEEANGLPYDNTVPHLETFQAGHLANRDRQRRTLVLPSEEEIGRTRGVYIEERNMGALESFNQRVALARTLDAPRSTVIPERVSELNGGKGFCSIM